MKIMNCNFRQTSIPQLFVLPNTDKHEMPKFLPLRNAQFLNGITLFHSNYSLPANSLPYSNVFPSMSGNRLTLELHTNNVEFQKPLIHLHHSFRPTGNHVQFLYTQRKFGTLAPSQIGVVGFFIMENAAIGALYAHRFLVVFKYLKQNKILIF